MNSMNKKIFFLIAISCLCIVGYTRNKPVTPAIDFYDLNFLRNPDFVNKILHERGFFEVNVITNDQLTINTIMLDQSRTKKIQATIVSCPGFIPGRKEGMTSLYAMLADRPYNFIFIDARGKGKSDGQLLTVEGIKHYGESEYLDIVATLQFVRKYNEDHAISSKIIVHGLCAGAYHAVKAINYLKEHDSATYHAVQGIVIDSGWPAIVDIAHTVIDAETKKNCSAYSIQFLHPYLAAFMIKIYTTLFQDQHSKQQPITEMIEQIEQPILFIHAQDDTFVPIDNMYPLIAKARQAYYWIVENSSHAISHLQHKEKYTEQFDTFIQNCVHTSNNEQI